jgi:hypothetical protein
MALEIIEAAEEEINELFPPKPGGLVDRYRKKAAEEEARRDEERNIAEKIEQSSYRAVKVAQQQPEVYASAVYTIGPGGTAQILPLRPHRFRAVVIATAPVPVPSPPAVPASTVAAQNVNPYPVTVVVTGGTATVTSVNGVTVGTGDGTFAVPAYGSIAVTYTVAPTWAWSYAGSGAPPVTVVLCKDQGAAIAGNGFPLPSGIPLPLDGRGQLYAFNPATATVQVAVIAQMYAPEK